MKIKATCANLSNVLFGVLIVTLVSSAASAFSAEPPAKSQPNGRSLARIIFARNTDEGDQTKQVKKLKWPATDLKVLVSRKKGPQPQFFVLLKGLFVVPQFQDWSLHWKEKQLRVRAKDGAFAVLVPLEGRITPVEFVMVDPRGRKQYEKIGVLFEDWNKLRPDAYDGPPENRRTSYVLAGVGLTSLTYKQSRIPDYSQRAVTLKLGYQHLIFPPRWDFAVGGYVTVLPISTSTSNVRAYFLGLNLRLGYVVPAVREPWRLSLLAGMYYATMSVTDDRFGYHNLAGPQLFPTLRRTFGSGDSASCYLKFSPVSEGFGLLSLDNREIAGGAAWTRLFKNGHPISAGLDYANLKFHKPRIDVSSTSLSFTVSYGF